MKNLWHDISLGTKVPEEFNTIIEIPRHSHNKYELDKETGLFALDRANYSAAPYPFDYGFAPQTLWEDGDPLDVVLITTSPIYPGVLVKVRPVAVIDMVDGGDSDYKIIAVPVDDRRFEEIHDLKDLNKHMVKEFTHFFETYKVLKGKEVVVTINSVMGKKEAMAAVEKSIKLYNDKYGKKVS